MKYTTDRITGKGKEEPADNITDKLQNSIIPKQTPLEPIERDLKWLSKYIEILIYNANTPTSTNESQRGNIPEINTHILAIPKPDTSAPYDVLISQYDLKWPMRLAILIAIAPCFSPSTLAPLAGSYSETNNIHQACCGVILANKEFLPTVDTIRFLIGGQAITNFVYIDSLIKSDGWLIQNHILQLKNMAENQIWNKQLVVPADEFLAIIRGERYEPVFNSNFPAKKITTKLFWEDLVLPYDTMQELKEVSIWLKHNVRIMQHKHLSRIIKPGFRCLFYGPPGTGKTLTASLLGKSTGLEVYRIDLSMVVSKWVGETEKNLKGIFDAAQNKKWILFFDEADSLFGKRTQTKSSNDRYANQEIAYLLQRIEDFPGLILLATNLKDNIDEAFSRRFQSMVFFPVPDPETRLYLWRKLLSTDFTLEEEINLQKIANDYEIAGGTNINVVRYCTLMAISRSSKTITAEDMETGIRKELRKSGKVL